MMSIEGWVLFGTVHTALLKAGYLNPVRRALSSTGPSVSLGGGRGRWPFCCSPKLLPASVRELESQRNSFEANSSALRTTENLTSLIEVSR
jgi:hypothetical protein